MDISGQPKAQEKWQEKIAKWKEAGFPTTDSSAPPKINPVFTQRVKDYLKRLNKPADAPVLVQKKLEDFTPSVQESSKVSDHSCFSNSTGPQAEKPTASAPDFSDVKTETRTPTINLASCPYKVNELPKFLNAVYSGEPLKEKPVEDVTVLAQQIEKSTASIHPSSCPYTGNYSELLNTLYSKPAIAEERIESEDHTENRGSLHKPLQENIVHWKEMLARWKQAETSCPYKVNELPKFLNAVYSAPSFKEKLVENNSASIDPASCPHTGNHSELSKWLNTLYSKPAIAEERVESEDHTEHSERLHKPLQEDIEELLQKILEISKGVARTGYQNAEAQIRQLVKEVEKHGAKGLEALAKAAWQEPSLQSWIPRKPSGTEFEYLPRSKENWYQPFTSNSSNSSYFELKEEKEPPICGLYENAAVGENLPVCPLHENAAVPNTLENIPFAKQPATGEWKAWKEFKHPVLSDDLGTCDVLYANAAQGEPLGTCKTYEHNAAQSHLKNLPWFLQDIWNEEPSLKSQMLKKTLGTRLGYTPKKNWYDAIKATGNNSLPASPYVKVKFHFDDSIGRPTALAVTENKPEAQAQGEIPLVKYEFEHPSMKTAIDLIRQKQVDTGNPPVTSLAVAGQDPVVSALRKLNQVAKEEICKAIDTTAVAVTTKHEEICKPLTEKVVNILPPKADDAWMPTVELPVESNKVPGALAVAGQDPVVSALRKLNQVAKEEICKAVDTTAVAVTTKPEEICKPLTDKTVDVLSPNKNGVLQFISTPAAKDQGSTELAVVYPSLEKMDSKELFQPLKEVKLEIHNNILSQYREVNSLDQNGTCESVESSPFSIIVPVILAAAAVAFTGYQAGKWIWKRYSAFKQAEAVKKATLEEAYKLREAADKFYREANTEESKTKSLIELEAAWLSYERILSKDEKAVQQAFNKWKQALNSGDQELKPMVAAGA